MTHTLPVPVVMVASLDPVLRDLTVGGLLCDLPGSVVLQHDLDPDGTVCRTVYGLADVREKVRLNRDHGCPTCAFREDVMTALRRLARGTDRHPVPSVVVLALPVAAEALPLVRALGGGASAPSGSGPAAAPPVVTAAVVTALEPDTLADELFGDDLLAERGLAVSPADRRAVGEVLAHQLELADVLVVPGDVPLSAAGAALLAHLVRVGPDVRPLDALRPADLPRRRRPLRDRRGDPLRAGPTGAADAAGVWTLDLRSRRPLHPGRLRARLEELGCDGVCGRGRFWLPTRPGTVCVWDGAGGQLSIGAREHRDGNPDVRLVLTGRDGDPDRRRRAFEAVLLTDAELAQGLSAWSGREDGFDPWLGERRRMSA